jgi:hypothetical protein
VCVGVGGAGRVWAVGGGSRWSGGQVQACGGDGGCYWGVRRSERGL